MKSYNSQREKISEETNSLRVRLSKKFQLFDTTKKI